MPSCCGRVMVLQHAFNEAVHKSVVVLSRAINNFLSNYDDLIIGGKFSHAAFI